MSIKEIISGIKLFGGLSSDELDEITLLCLEKKFDMVKNYMNFLIRTTT